MKKRILFIVRQFILERERHDDVQHNRVKFEFEMDNKSGRNYHLYKSIEMLFDKLK